MLVPNIWKIIFQKFRISIREKTAQQMVNWNTTLFEIQASLFQMVENSAIKIEIAALDPLILNHLK